MWTIGPDFYASRTFQDFDGTLDSKISMGLVATWDYARGSSIEVWERLLVYSPQPGTEDIQGRCEGGQKPVEQLNTSL